MSNFLLREYAPISDVAWQAIDEEARERLLPGLAARKLVDFSGPHGWQYSATGLGRVREVPGVGEGVDALQRRVLPAVELYARFTVSRAELRDADRGAEDIDFASLDEAARRVASAENTAIFHGWEAAGIAGIAEASTHDPLTLGEDCARYPHHVARAVQALLDVGVGGPYGLVLGSEAYTHVQQFSEHGGYPLLEHLRKIAGGPLVWAPGVRGAVLMSLRGGDFLFECGEDLSVGYEAHDERSLRLYLVESFTFRAVTDDAAVALTP